MRSEARKKALGEVFTPPKLVNEMLDQLPKEAWIDPTKTFLDNSCGSGNFLVEIKNKLLNHGHSLDNILGRIYGVDIMHDNVDETRERLDPNNEYKDIMENNIVCHNALTYHYRFDGTIFEDPIKLFE